ncbi:uncharacterized protein [Miscanthus floridulus]|uniref:uncharacterized protein n=1 Tax=Miscanthus floridulus TaxID=154761 RepID=UPI003457A114
MTTGADAIDWPNQHSRMDDGGDDGFAQHDDNTIVASIADGITQHGDDNQIANEGGEERRDWGHNMGLGLQRLNRARRGKLQVVITEGHIRPVVPLVAAKFASECNIIVRNHVPILPHWKLYKKKHASSSKEKEPKEKEPNEKEPKEKEPASAYVDLFLGKLKAKFDINTEDNTVKKGCIEMMQSAVRQQRYRLKAEYFDPFPLHLVTKTSPVKCMTDEQWLKLLESWKSPKKMEMCQKNKDNRGKVKYHHTIGSRAYMVHVENLDDKYNDEEPNAFDLFKECHYRKKNATPLLYKRLLLRWKTSYLQQQKVKNLSLRLKLLLMCLLRTPRRISSCRMWGTRMPGVFPMSRALNWKRRKRPMLSFVYKWLICQIKCKNLSRQGLLIERR